MNETESGAYGAIASLTSSATSAPQASWGKLSSSPCPLPLHTTAFHSTSRHCLLTHSVTSGIWTAHFSSLVTVVVLRQAFSSEWKGTILNRAPVSWGKIFATRSSNLGLSFTRGLHTSSSASSSSLHFSSSFSLSLSLSFIFPARRHQEKLFLSPQQSHRGSIDISPLIN